MHGDRVCPGVDADQDDDHLSVVCHETPTVGNPSPPCPTGSSDRQDVLQKVYYEYKSMHGLEFISLTRPKPSSSLPNLFDNGEVSGRSFSACKSLIEPTSLPSQPSSCDSTDPSGWPLPCPRLRGLSC